MSKTIEIKNGLRQGDVLVPMLINRVLDNVVKNIKVMENGTIINKSQQIMAYADVVILGRSKKEIEDAYAALRRLRQEATRAGYEINVGKTKLIVIEEIRRQHPLSYEIDGESIISFGFTVSWIFNDK